jgi:hypothetical protein
VIEAFLFSGAVVQPWGNKIANLSQEPAYQLVIWVERIQQPGLAGQAAYTILMVIIQWMIWSVLSYLLLWRIARTPSV